MYSFRNTSVRTLGVILLLLAVLVLTGCSGSTAEETPADEQNTITVTDCIGRQVEVPANVERIACLYAFSGHITTMLGRGEDIVAINNGQSRDVLLSKICPSVGKNPIPYYNGLEIEELIKTDPDVAFIQLDTGLNEAEAEKLDKFHIPYVVIDFHSIEEQMNAIEIIGQTLGCSDQAREYNAYYQDCIDRVTAGVDDLSEADKVRLYHSVNEATRTDSPNSLPAEWTQRIGVINVSVDKPLKLLEGKNFASLEQILLWDPDVIIVNEAGVANYIMTNTQWSPLTAVKEKKVYQMPIGMSRWGHPGGMETPLATLWAAKTIYPDRFEEMDINHEARAYYERFFNYSVTDEELSQILNGERMRIPKNQQ